MENKTVSVRFGGKLISAEAGTTISQIISAGMPCGGHGRCGKCKIVAHGCLSEPTKAELEHLSEAELERGVRLACLARAMGDCEIEPLAREEGARIVTGGDMADITLSPAFCEYGVAIDIGTTTLAARLYGTDGSVLAEVSRMNPQAKWGADVISRIEACLGGKADELRAAITEALDAIILELATLAGIDSLDIDGVVITGNTVMLSILTGESVEPLSHAPFELVRPFGEELFASDLGLDSLAGGVEVYLPPCVAAFVGADVTCAALATSLCNADTAMLVDIGTNGEMMLWHGGVLTACSTAAGPTFEGVGIECGMRAAARAIDKVSISGGKLLSHVIGDTEAAGICGSGLVDAVACMLDAEIVDESGYLEGGTFSISGGVTISQKDVRALQLAKSAVCAGMRTLLESCGIDERVVPVLYIAGGFGNYLNAASAARIGLLPEGLASVSRAVGNAALAGAAMLLLSYETRAECERIRGARVIELSTSDVFAEYYLDGMSFE